MMSKYVGAWESNLARFLSFLPQVVRQVSGYGSSWELKPYGRQRGMLSGPQVLGGPGRRVLKQDVAEI